MMHRTEVIKILNQQHANLERALWCKILILGSGQVARDDATSASDIDMLVEFDRPVGACSNYLHYKITLKVFWAARWI